MIVRRRRSAGSRILIVLVSVMAAGLVATAAMITVWALRSNSAATDELLALNSTWLSDAVGSASSPAVTTRNGQLVLIRASTEDPGSRRAPTLVVSESGDGEVWAPVGSLPPDARWREPFVAASIDGRVLIYAGDGAIFVSRDGATWDQVAGGASGVRLLQSPVAVAGDGWYAAVLDQTGFGLARSGNGTSWEPIGPRLGSDLPGFEVTDAVVGVLADRRMIAIINGGARDGDSSGSSSESASMMAVSRSPYEVWGNWHATGMSLVDPVPFFVDSQLFALDRHVVGNGTRGRLSLYEVTPADVEFLSDMPGAGRISAPSVASAFGFVFAFYESSRPDRDPPPFLAIVSRPRVLVTRIPAGNLFMASALH